MPHISANKHINWSEQGVKQCKTYKVCGKLAVDRFFCFKEN